MKQQNMSDEPATNETSNGRDHRGRFVAGNPGGPGNTHGRKSAQLRAALLRAVDEEKLEEAARAILEKACKGDVIAFREMCDRVLGRAASSDLVERVEALETIAGMNQHEH